MVYLNPWRIMLLWFTYDDSSSLIWQVTPSLFLSLVTDCHTGLPKVEKYSVNHWSDKQVVTPLLATLSSLPASEGANHLSSYRGRPPHVTIGLLSLMTDRYIGPHRVEKNSHQPLATWARLSSLAGDPHCEAFPPARKKFLTHPAWGDTEGGDYFLEVSFVCSSMQPLAVKSGKYPSMLLL